MFTIADIRRIGLSCLCVGWGGVVGGGVAAHCIMRSHTIVSEGLLPLQIFNSMLTLACNLINKYIEQAAILYH